MVSGDEQQYPSTPAAGGDIPPGEEPVAGGMANGLDADQASSGSPVPGSRSPEEAARFQPADQAGRAGGEPHDSDSRNENKGGVNAPPSRRRSHRAGQPLEEAVSSEGPGQKEWFILKVQSNREDSICQSLKRRVSMAGLDEYFGEIIVPTETVSEFKGGKKRVVKRKLYPGYIVVNMVLNDDTWFLVRETPGIGDFTGAAGKPMPMQPHEVQRIVATEEEQAVEAPKLKIGFRVGDRVKINEGMFDNFEGNVEAIDETNGRVTVMINIFGRSTPVELEYWQVEAM